MLVSIVAADGLVLKYQAISIHHTDWMTLVLIQYDNKCSFLVITHQGYTIIHLAEKWTSHLGANATPLKHLWYCCIISDKLYVKRPLMITLKLAVILLFSQRYTVSMEFLGQFERHCGSQASVKRLRAHPSYNTFMSRWSLPVYFQIRYEDWSCMDHICQRIYEYNTVKHNTVHVLLTT